MTTSITRKDQLAIIGIILLTLGNFLFAAASGKIAGRVFDAETNEPLPGANVIVEGTTLGAAADTDGNYFILNVRPGKQTVTASVIGYIQLKVTDVGVQVGLTTPLDFALTPTTVEGEEVTIIASRPVIQTDVGNSRTILDGSELAALPVGSFKEVLDKQMGIQDVDARGLFMRGQRQFSISMMIDGIETRDIIDDQVYTRFNPDEIQQAEISAGGYDASMGNATAGVINLVTKEGGNRYTGTFDYRLSQPGRKHFGPSIKYWYDKYYLEGWTNDTATVQWSYTDPSGGQVWIDTTVNRWERIAHAQDKSSPYYDRPSLIQELYRYFMRDEATRYGDESDMVISGTFGGPIPFIKNTSFFTSFRREKSYYLYPGPLDHYFDQNGLIKLTTRPSKSIKVSAHFRYTEKTGLNRYDYYRSEAQTGDLGIMSPDFQSEKRFAFEGVEQVAWSGYGAWPYTCQMGIFSQYRHQYGLTFTHQLSPRTFYEVKLLADYVRTHGDQPPLRDTSLVVILTDPNDPTARVTLTGPMAQAPLGFWEVPISNVMEFVLGGSYGYVERNYARSTGLRVNLTSQVDSYNQLNLGFEYLSYEFRKREYRNTIDRMGKWLWHVRPASAALWVMDNLTFEGAVINASVRADFRIPDQWWNWRSDPYNPVWVWTGSEPGDSAGIEELYQPPIKTAIAPRLSISHPIGEAAKVYFNWGHYYKEPPFERQYIYYRRDALFFQHFGDPELPFEKAVQYEVGYEHNIANVLRLALSGYHKDVKNLLMDRISFRSYERQETEYANFYTWGPNRYMSSQGLEARIEKRQGRFLTAWFNYSVQMYSRGVYGFRAFYEDTTQAPGEFDRESLENQNLKRPTEARFNLGMDFHTPPDFGPSLLGFRPMADINLNFLLWWRQQPPETYNPGRVETPYAPRYNVRWIPHWAVNMTFNKKFRIGSRFTPVFYVEVYNLFNTKNMWRGAFNEKQAAFENYMAALDEVGGKPGERGDLAEEAIGNNPTTLLPFNGSPWFLYLNPRQIWAGIRFELN
ncbi:MAG: TonB-dependent receptor [Fidelibacterota bacterium]|nr:MAG: TonB-dependent receptor [Candidatus Neomarinimicrobiota bacterium]